MKEKSVHSHNYVLIMAGGTGTRLFPRSTEKLPKQFQKIIGKKTLIEQTYDRVKKIVNDNHIYISSHSQYFNLLKKYFPKIPSRNYILEPIKKNTGPAMAFATAFIYERDKDAIIITNASDHLVEKSDEYAAKILAGARVVKNNSNYILCIGITPTSPHTGLGYIEIEKEKEFAKEGDTVIYKGKRYIYRVTNKLIVDPNEVKYLTKRLNYEQLTLQTCWPPGTTLKRLLVIAKPEREVL